LRAGGAFVRVGVSGGSQIPTDVNNGDDIMKWLDDRGIIESEFTKMNRMMKKAGDLEVSQKKGEDDG